MKRETNWYYYSNNGEVRHRNDNHSINQGGVDKKFNSIPFSLFIQQTLF